MERGIKVSLSTGCPCPGGALGYVLGGYVPPGTPNWHPVLKKISPTPLGGTYPYR